MATNKILIVAVVLLTIAVAYLLNSKFHILGKRFSTDFNNSKPQKSNEGILSDATTETTATETTQPDATKGNFNVILEVAKKDRAFKRYTELKVWGHDIRMETEDSLRFKLFIPILAPIADTTRHKDSLRLFFDKNVWIEIPADE
jgi:hypothetical protein